MDDDILRFVVRVKIIRNSLILCTGEEPIDIVTHSQFSGIAKRYIQPTCSFRFGHQLHNIVAKHEERAHTRRLKILNDLFQLRLTVVYDFIVGFHGISFLKRCFTTHEYLICRAHTSAVRPLLSERCRPLACTHTGLL